MIVSSSFCQQQQQTQQQNQIQNINHNEHNEHNKEATLTATEVREFDRYYQLYSQDNDCENENELIESNNSLSSIQINEILDDKIGSNIENILLFLKERDEKLTIQEFNYCFSQIFGQEEIYYQALIKDNQLVMQRAFNMIPKMNLTDLDEDFEQIIYLAQKLVNSSLIYVKEEKLWQNITGIIIRKQNREAKEKDYSKAQSYLELYIGMNSMNFENMQVLHGIVKMQKFIMKGLEFLSIQDMINFMMITAKKGLYLDDVQLKEFDSQFEDQFNGLTIQQICDILFCYDKFAYQHSQLSDRLENYLKHYVKGIDHECYIQYLEYENKHSQVQQQKRIEQQQQLQLLGGEKKKQKKKEYKEIQEITQNFYLKNIELSYSQYEIQKYEEMDYFEQLNMENIKFQHYVSLVDNMSRLKNFSQLKIWEKMESMFGEFIKNVQKYQLFDKIEGRQISTIIQGFDRNFQGSIQFWDETFCADNLREFNIRLMDNYTVMKNLTRNYYYSKDHLNLCLSYLINVKGKQEVASFEYLDGKEERFVLESFEVYFMNMYNCLKNEDIQDQDRVFFLKSLKSLCVEISRKLIKGEKKFTRFQVHDMLKLQQIFQMSMVMYGNYFKEIEEEMELLERKLLKQQVDFGCIDISKIVVMMDYLQQCEFSKVNKQLQNFEGKLENILIYYLQEISEVELGVLFGQFYKYDLQSEYIWSMLQIKLIEYMELLSVTDLLMVVKIVEQKFQHFVDEEFYDLFLQVLEIKARYIHYMDIQNYEKNFSCSDYELGQKVVEKLGQIIEDLKVYGQQDIYDDDIKQLELDSSFITRVCGLSLNDVIFMNQADFNRSQDLQKYFEEVDQFKLIQQLQ